MSTYMGRELELLVQSMICGALLVLVYDGIRIFRIIGKRVKSGYCGGYFVLERSRAFFIFYVSERERGKRAVLSALRNFAGSRCLVLGNRAFL